MKKLSKTKQQAIKGGTTNLGCNQIGGPSCFDPYCTCVIHTCRKEPDNPICKEMLACVHLCGLTDS